MRLGRPSPIGSKRCNKKEALMGKVIVFTNVSLDGIMQAPGRPDEDLRGGFKHGGWGIPYAAMA